jgi:D-glycerate 3-kinase
MNEAQVREFIMYYERITRAMLAEMPGRADMTLALDEAHRIVPP